MKKDASVRRPRNRDYPLTTKGGQLAARVRSASNHLSESQREELLKKGMQIIYGGNGIKETVSHR